MAEKLLHVLPGDGSSGPLDGVHLPQAELRVVATHLCVGKLSLNHVLAPFLSE